MQMESIDGRVIPVIYESVQAIRNQFLNESGYVIADRVGWWKIALASLGFNMHVGNFRAAGWSSLMPFYLFKCPCGGLHVNYRQGYEGRLDCTGSDYPEG